MNARHALAVVVLLVACGGEDRPVLIGDFASRSTLVDCRPLGPDTVALGSIMSARPISDSTMLVVDGSGRQLVILDATLRVIRRLEFPDEGPGSIARLLDAAASGDSLIVLADGGRNRLVGITPEGAALWDFDTGFPPQSIAFAGGRLLVTAVGLDPRIPGLVHERIGPRLVSLDVPFIPHQDGLARMFVNSASLYGLPDGSAVLAHELIWPRAWLIPAHGAPRRVEVPLPERTSRQIGFVPTMPMREDELDDLLVPVMGLSVDPASGDIFYVTRTGDERDSHSEKAIVRATRDFVYLGSIRLPINAVEVVYLPHAPDSLIVSDYDLGWHRCPVPPVRQG